MLSLKTIKKYEPEMKRLKVSEVARSPRGFLTAYKKAGSPDKLSPKWKQTREAFIARHNSQYKRNPHYRQYLSLIAWGYKPTKRHNNE
jgi:hypothetical protein